MTEPAEQERIKTETREFIYECLDFAWDLGSYGMGIHLHAVAAFAAGQELTESMGKSLDRPNSNYLINPYTLGWRGDPDFKKFTPYAKSPDSAQHFLLLIAMNGKYDRLKKEQAERRVEALLSASKAGMPIDETAFSNEFRTRQLEAAVYKLGCMLGVTVQLVYDAKEIGAPVPATYRPTRGIAWDSNWQRLFGEQEVPDIDQLYQQAHAVFIANADPTDPLLAHLFPVTTLPNLDTR